MGKWTVSFTNVFELSSKAFLARILDKDNAETLDSDSFGIVGFGIVITVSLTVLGTSIASTGSSSFIFGEGIAMTSSATFGVSVFLTTSTIE